MASFFGVVVLLSSCAPVAGLAPSSRLLLQRRGVLSGLGCAALAPLPGFAATKKYTVDDARAAIADIRKARAALNDADAMLAKRDFDAVTALLAASPLADFEKDATIILQSPVLSPEDKKAIGTIRRYGVGADVTIMLGGLNAAAVEEDGFGCRSYLAKAKGALDELILIAKSGGLR